MEYAAEPNSAATSLWGVCDQNWTIYNRLEIYFNTLTRMPGAINAAIADNYDLNVRKTLGHELGHTVGLSHNSGAASATCSSSTASGSDDSMRSGWVGTSLLYLTYNSHHVDCHVNAFY